MKIKMLTGLAGVNFMLEPGDVVDWPNEEAMRLIKSGAAVLEESKPETAVRPQAPETRTAPEATVPVQLGGRARKGRR